MKANSSLEQQIKKMDNENKKIKAKNLKSKTPPPSNKSISHEEESTAKTNSSFQE